MIRPWSVRLNAEADRLTRLGNRAWGPVSLHAVNHIEEAARSLRKAAEDMADRERKWRPTACACKAKPKKWSDAWWKKHNAEMRGRRKERT